MNVAKQLISEDVYLHQWHQDFEQWHGDDGMRRMRAVSMAVLLDQNTATNAALMVAPGSHKRLLQPLPYQPNPTPQQLVFRTFTGPILPDHLMKDVSDRCGIVHCAGEPGDVVMFDCATLHGSHTNISPWPRQNLFYVYNAISNTMSGGGYDKTKSQERPEHHCSRDPDDAGVALPAFQNDFTKFKRK